NLSEGGLGAWLAREERRPFDLARGPLFRASLARLGESDHVLLLSMHHIVADGWSFDVLMRDLGELYGAARERRAPQLPELPIPYADSAACQRGRPSGDRLDESLAYWRARLSNVPVLELPTDRARTATRSSEG